MITLLTGWGLSGRLAKLIAYVGVPLIAAGAIVLAVFLYGTSRYDAGVTDERTRWERRIEQAKAAQRQRERQADANRRAAETRDAAAATQRKQEIDNATRNLPDQAPSARQRSRACIELRRQAAAAGGAQPAC